MHEPPQSASIPGMLLSCCAFHYAAVSRNIHDVLLAAVFDIYDLTDP